MTGSKALSWSCPLSAWCAVLCRLLEQLEGRRPSAAPLQFDQFLMQMTLGWVISSYAKWTPSLPMLPYLAPPNGMPSNR